MEFVNPAEKPLSGQKNKWKVGDDMQSAIDAFEKQHSVPQIYRDRLGRYQFMPVRTGIKDCYGFVYRILGKAVK